MCANYHFISFAGGYRFKESAKRINEEAKSLGIFKTIKVYSEKDLPIQLIASPLFLFDRGYGYWAWKPWVILDQILKIPNNDIVVYADCGCKVHNDVCAWNNQMMKLENTEALFFSYRENLDYPWGSSKMKEWCKKSVFQYFSDGICSDLPEKMQLWSGCLFLKRTESTIEFIKDWLKITLFHPNLVCDAFGMERSVQVVEYKEHRHDQALLSAIVYNNSSLDCLILPEEVEPSQHYHTPFITAMRIRAPRRLPSTSKSTQITNFLKKVLGDTLYRKLHFW